MPHSPKTHPNTRSGLLGACVAVILIAVVEGTSLPMTCKLHDPSNGPCLMQQWQNIFINGNKDIPGLPSVDPYKPKNVRISVNIPILSLNMNLKKIVVTGMSQAKVSDVSFTNAESLKLTMTIPSVHIKGNYAIDGRILLLNLNGRGPLNIEMSDIVIGITMELKTIERNGEHLFEPTSVVTEAKHIGNMHLQFENLFADNPALTESANEVFNQNWREIIDLARPVIQETMDTSLLGQAKSFLSHVPARLIFSDLS